MSRAACKTVICAIGNLNNFKKKDFRKAFQNTEIANAVAADESQGTIWSILEQKNFDSDEREYLRGCLKGYTE